MGGLLAAAAGIGIAWALIKGLVSAAPPDIPRLQDAGMNWPAMSFAILVSSVAMVGCSAAAPIVVATGANLEGVLRAGGARLTGNRHSNRIRAGFILIQTAASVVLVIASLLIVLSVRAMLRSDVGFSHPDAVTMNLSVRGRQDEADTRRRFYANLLDRLRHEPGVTDAAGVLVRPLERPIGWDRSYRLEFDTARREGQLPASNFEVITPEYFRAVGTPLLEGRDFTDRDGENAPRVAYSLRC